MTRGSKIALGVSAGILLVFLGPLVLFGASNLGAGLLSLVLERRPSVKEMTGTFQFHGAGAPTTLILRSDGTFTEDDKESSIAHRTEGHWNYSYEENYARVTFMPFKDPKDAGSATRGFGTACFKPRWGKTRIVIDDDLGDEFRKVGD